MMASHPTVASTTMTNPTSAQPTCQNCSTSTTPLWRRDEMGSVLCNACGLFLKLHGRPRPISLKTDVIKSRNRVKTMRPDMAMKKKQAHDNATATALAAVRRTSQHHKSNGHDDTNSPISRTGTPSMYDPHLPVFQGVEGSQFQSPSLPQYALPGGSPNRPASPLNGEQQSDVPQTHEQLIAANSSLKTRVSELDLINELYRGRLAQLEQEMQGQEDYRHQAEAATKAEAEALRKLEEVQKQLEDSHRRENILKRRLDEIEQELELKTAAQLADEKLNEQAEDSEPPAKKARIEEDKLEEMNALSTPMSTS